MPRLLVTTNALEDACQAGFAAVEHAAAGEFGERLQFIGVGLLIRHSFKVIV